MNIPPLISRTPPPINDVVDEEDEEEDDNDITVFPTLDFCDSKVSEKSLDEVQIVSSIGDFDDDVKKPCRKETSDSHYSEKTNFPNEDLPLTTTIEASNEEAVLNKIICNHVNSIDTSSLNGKCGSSEHVCLDKSLCDEKVNSSISLGNYQNEIISKSICDKSENLYDNNPVDIDKSSRNTDSVLFINDKDIQLEKPDIISSCEPYSYITNEFKEDYLFSKFEETSISSESDMNYNETKTNSIDVRLVEGQESSPEKDSADVYRKNDCDCLDKCSCGGEFNDQGNSSEKVFSNNAESKELKSESALLYENANLPDQDSVPSQFSSDYDSISVNDPVTKEIHLAPVNVENSTVSKEDLEDTDIAIQVDFDDTPDLHCDPGLSEFDAAFPDFVQNYQLDQPNEEEEFSDFVVCTYNPMQVTAESKPVDSYQVFREQSDENALPPAMLLCLKEELKKTSIWNKLSSLENTPALDYRWGESYSSSRLLSALKIDSRNILSGNWSKSSRKMNMDDFRGNNDTNESYSEIPFSKISVPHPQFEWVGSGLINPLDDGSNPRFKKSLSTLSSEAEKLISLFPDLSYLKQNFIVFPKNIN